MKNNNINHKKIAKLFKALSEPMRVKIIDTISSGELCACEVLKSLSISQSTLSHHMKILMACDLVIGRKKATWMYYSINRKTVNNMLDILMLITSKKSRE
ncbi:MAG: winged helix-turn-helix transcriptional regulator [Oligoflexia bacterium]|nr:winged helix-turn-helix transcriptional regulator [Oligoflexia bacterium]